MQNLLKNMLTNLIILTSLILSISANGEIGTKEKRVELSEMLVKKLLKDYSEKLQQEKGSFPVYHYVEGTLYLENEKLNIQLVGDAIFDGEWLTEDASFLIEDEAGQRYFCQVVANATSETFYKRFSPDTDYYTKSANLLDEGVKPSLENPAPYFWLDMDSIADINIDKL